MITVSLCMIVKNEEESIENCLRSIKDIADEIIIVDTGSTDKTKEIAGNFKSEIFDFTWIDDFAAARNFSFDKATKDYILWLDADDVFLEEDIIKFIQLKNTLNLSIDSVTMVYDYGFDEYGNVSLSFRRNRLVKREKNFKWYGPVHEYLDVNGNIINSDIHVTHRRIKFSSDRNLKIFQNRLKKGEQFSVRDTYYYANELFDHKMYEQAIKYYNLLLNNEEAWVEDKIRICSRLTDYYYNNIEEQKKYIFKSFELSAPRDEFCCKLGALFLNENKFGDAIFWFELAMKLERPKDNWGFFNDYYSTWLPHIQLCICYDRIGNHKLAYEHNEIAAKFRPNDQCVAYNRAYFEKLGYMKPVNGEVDK